MILAFLRRFRQFRDLEQLADELRAAAEARRELQGEVRTLREELYEQREVARVAAESERQCYRMLVNFEFQMRHGIAPFPDAPKLPEKLARHDDGGGIQMPYTNARSLQADIAEKNRAEINKAFGVQ